MIFTELDERGIKQYHIHGIEDWDSFDSLIKILEQWYNAKLQNLDDGIFTRKAYLKIKSFAIVLEHHDDIGNYFYSCDSNAHVLLDNIAKDLESKFKN